MNGVDNILDGTHGAFDLVDYSFAPAGVNVNLALGSATDGGGGTDTLINIEGVNGSMFGDTLIGDAFDNWFFDIGGAGDLFDGGDGTEGEDMSRSSQAGGTTR